MNQAYYHSTVEEFINKNNLEILGQLNSRGAEFYKQFGDVVTSWESSIEILQESLAELIQLNSSSKEWGILLEYEIPRLSSRIDVVLLADDLIFVIEFKFERNDFFPEDIRQVEDYANDLKDFHLESKGKIIIPILLSPLAKDINQELLFSSDDYVLPCFKLNKQNIANNLYRVYKQYHNSSKDKIKHHQWEQSEYQPTPTIIQAAKALFAGQKVESITKHGASEVDIFKTSRYVINAINDARKKNKKIVCFVTGVPGAGKTLVGLNIVHEKDKFDGEEINTAYFSGNGPLINVLREALSRDHNENQMRLYKDKKITVKPTKNDSDRKIKSKIQNLHLFIKDGIRKSTPPTERIVVFDEAQRCWDAKQFSSKAKQNQNREKNPFIIEQKSEAELLFEFMSRHEGWSVIIALVGGGQEINTGEGGIGEWGKAIENKYQDWEVHISPQLLSGDASTAGQVLFNVVPNDVVIHQDRNLHLSINQRSFKATNLNTWVNFLINNQPNEALLLADSIKKEYPLFLTRNISTAKKWLKQKKSGTKRIGLVASSGGLRLKPEGIHVRELIDEALWFLNKEEDVRSSYCLEIVATEYKVQGLELDWVGICWDADLRRKNGKWDFKNFSGTKWQHTKTLAEQKFLLNTYRVLLTRAREGLIIFVPLGDTNDETRLPEFYNPIFEYLKSCGFSLI